jgi:hypothetical protein
MAMRGGEDTMAYGGWYPEPTNYFGICPRCVQPFVVPQGAYWSVVPPRPECACSSSYVTNTTILFETPHTPTDTPDANAPAPEEDVDTGAWMDERDAEPSEGPDPVEP